MPVVVLHLRTSLDLQPAVLPSTNASVCMEKTLLVTLTNLHVVC